MSKFIFLKSLRELLTPLKRLIDRKAENVNWNENDPSSNSYIANRPFYSETKEVITKVLPEITYTAGDTELVNLTESLVEGRIYTVTWDGISYDCVARNYDGYLMLGNNAIYEYDGGVETDTGEPFAMETEGNSTRLYIYTRDQKELIISISYSRIQKYIHKIPSEYLPEISSIGKEGTGDSAEIFNDYENNVASGYASHAEGTWTIASGWASHAEGESTQAFSDYSHAEGYNTTTNGTYAHAEGYTTTAGGYAAHSEGYHTIASSTYQHVQGKYNIEDSSYKYAHIVGNGSSNSKRSNAHTIDWNGLGWFAGGLKVGGTGQDDANAKSIATEAYVDEKIAAIPTPDVSGQIAASVAALVDSAPETLDTLNELANALGDDPNFATTVTTQLGTLSKQINEPKNSIVFIDQVNGYTYIACMRDGNFVTYCVTQSIEISVHPTKIEYYVGDTFDPTGMIIVATAQDGTIREVTNYSCMPEVINEDTTSIKVTYTENDTTYEAIIPITVKAITDLLIDFDYTDNGDGTYTITDWKGTYNGEPSTEIIIPNNKNVIV